MDTTMSRPLEDALLAVLHHFGNPAGRQGGGFVTSLLETMDRADSSNLARLINAFPEFATPFMLVKETPGGIETLEALANEIRR